MGFSEERLDLENKVNSLQARAADRPMLLVPYIAEIYNKQLYLDAGYINTALKD